MKKRCGCDCDCEFYEREREHWSKALEEALAAMKKKDSHLYRLMKEKVKTIPLVKSPILRLTNIAGHFHRNNADGYITLKGDSNIGSAQLVLHELVHSIGGTELDSVSITEWCFPNQNGTPLQSEFVLFEVEGGKFTSWNRRSGVVKLNRSRKTIANFVPKKKAFQIPSKAPKGPSKALKFQIPANKQYTRRHKRSFSNQSSKSASLKSTL